MKKKKKKKIKKILNPVYECHIHLLIISFIYLFLNCVFKGVKPHGLVTISFIPRLSDNKLL